MAGTRWPSHQRSRWSIRSTAASWDSVSALSSCRKSRTSGRRPWRQRSQSRVSGPVHLSFSDVGGWVTLLGSAIVRLLQPEFQGHAVGGAGQLFSPSLRRATEAGRDLSPLIALRPHIGQASFLL